MFPRLSFLSVPRAIRTNTKNSINGNTLRITIASQRNYSLKTMYSMYDTETASTAAPESPTHYNNINNNNNNNNNKAYNNNTHNSNTLPSNNNRASFPVDNPPYPTTKRIFQIQPIDSNHSVDSAINPFAAFNPQ